jgi:hypothetical protein
MRVPLPHAFLARYHFDMVGELRREREDITTRTLNGTVIE